MKINLLAIVACAILASCAATPQPWPAAPEVTTVDMPIAVACKTPLPSKPVFAFDALGIGRDIYTQVATLLADRRQRLGYENELEAALSACQ